VTYLHPGPIHSAEITSVRLAGRTGVGGMWTKAHRARHEAGLTEVVSTCAVGEVARRLERADPPRSGCATPTLPVVGAIAWRLRGVIGDGDFGDGVFDDLFALHQAYAVKCIEESNLPEYGKPFADAAVRAIRDKAKTYLDKLNRS
jgi:hypothetical protein